LPLLPAVAYTTAEAIAGIICLVIAWRTRRSSPDLAAIARMPLGELAFERARKLGGLTIFAAPSRS